MNVKKGSTNVSVYVNFVDSTTGAPETGLTITNIAASYTREGEANVSDAALEVLAGADDDARAAAAHADWSGTQIAAIEAPGLYRIDFPDAAFATGATWVILSATCTGCAPVHIFCQLEAVPADITHINGSAASATSGVVDANVTQINGTAIDGTGSPADPWGPA